MLEFPEATSRLRILATPHKYKINYLDVQKNLKSRLSNYEFAKSG